MVNCHKQKHALVNPIAMIKKERERKKRDIVEKPTVEGKQNY